MKIKFVCGKTFKMDDGDIAFLKGEVYTFTLRDATFRTMKDYDKDTHDMNFEDMFVKAQMIPYQAILDGKKTYKYKTLYGGSTRAGL